MAHTVTELRKCVLICHNCHFEIHSGIGTGKIPENPPRFNEEFAVLEKSLLKEEFKLELEKKIKHHA